MQSPTDERVLSIQRIAYLASFLQDVQDKRRGNTATTAVTIGY